MARTTNITFGQVAQIADTLKAAGTRPTARAVRERIGSGSMGTIHKLLQQWQGKASAENDDENEASTLPDHIQKALMDFIGTEIATACEPINDELQSAKEAADQIALDNERQYETIVSLENDIDNLRQERAAAMAQLNLTRDDLYQANNERATLHAENTQLKMELDRSQRQTEMFASWGPELEKAKTQLAEAREGRTDAQREAAVLQAQLTAEKAKTDELIARLKTAESRANSADQELKQANNHYQACAARLEAAAREIESLRKPKAAPAPKTTKAKSPTVKKTDASI